MSAVWYVRRGDNSEGPYSLSDLNDLARSGVIKNEDLVRSDQMTDWVKAADLPGLAFPAAAAGFDQPPPLKRSTSADIPAAPPPLQPGSQKIEPNISPPQAPPASFSQPAGSGRKSPLLKILLVVVSICILVLIGYFAMNYFTNREIPTAVSNNGSDPVTDSTDQESFPTGDPYIVEEPIRQWLASLAFNEPYELFFIDELDLIDLDQYGDKMLLVYEIVSSHDNQFTVLLGYAYSEWIGRLYIKPVDGVLTVTDYEEIAPVGLDD